MTARPASRSARVSARAAHALVEEPRAVDRDARVLGERFQDALVMRREAAGRVEKAETTPMTAPTTFRGTHSSARIPSRVVHLALARSARRLHVTDADRDALGRHAADDPLADSAPRACATPRSERRERPPARRASARC